MANESVNQSARTYPTTALSPFIRPFAALLTTYRRDGTPVGTPVNIAVDNDRAFIRTWDTSGKFKRIGNNPTVSIAPSTRRGRVTGPEIRAHARVLEGEEARLAGQLLSHKHSIVQGILVPLSHRIARYKTVHIELTPLDT